MAKTAVKNFHIPLSSEMYEALRAEAERSQRPATTLAREVLEKWLEQQRRAAIEADIYAFAMANAGTELDLDEELQEASLQSLARHLKELEDVEG